MIPKYDDIINLPRPVSKNHPHMSIRDRAAQFSPFAALTGYDDLIKDTAKKTDVDPADEYLNNLTYEEPLE